MPVIDFLSAHSITDLLLGTAGMAAYPPGATFGPRLLHDFEFLWIIEGNATATFDKQQIDALPDTVLLARPGMTQRFDWDVHKRTIHAYFHFSFDYSDWPPLAQWPVARRISSEDILRPLFRYVIGLAQTPDESVAPLLASVVTLMLRAFLDGKTAIALEPHENLPPAVQKALAAIRRALAQDPPAALTLHDLGAAAHVTREHLCRLFRRHLNLGPLECVGLARLERAASLLVRTNLPVKQIADVTGFVSPYHFSNKFRKVYGFSPRDYRMSMQSGFFIAKNPVIQHLQIPLLDNIKPNL
jgi:AraC-like DNA-binding protein